MKIIIKGADFKDNNLESTTISKYYSVTYSGSGVSSSSAPKTIAYGDDNYATQDLVATIKVLSSYTFNSVTSVSVGGKALSTSDYTVSGQIVTVPANKINGNVVITVATEKVNTQPEQPGTGGDNTGTPELVTVYFANKDFTAPGKDDGTGVRFDQKVNFDNVPTADTSVTVSLTSNSDNLTGKALTIFGNGDNTQKLGTITVGTPTTVTLKAGWDKIWFFGGNIFLTQAETLHLEIVGDVLIYPEGDDAVVIYEGTITQTNSTGDASGTRLDQKIKFSEALSDDATVKVYVTSFGTWTGKTASVYANADSTRNFGNITFDSGLPKEISLKAGDTGLWFFNAGLKAIEPEKLGIRVVLK